MKRELPVRFREGLGVQLPRATRLVILTRQHAAEAAAVMRTRMAKLKLTVHDRKTRTCSVPDETFTFRGFTFGRQTSWRTGRA
jgi:RNA-directed DNA polymerase